MKLLWPLMFSWCSTTQAHEADSFPPARNGLWCAQQPLWLQSNPSWRSADVSCVPERHNGLNLHCTRALINAEERPTTKSQPNSPRPQPSSTASKIAAIQCNTDIWLPGSLIMPFPPSSMTRLTMPTSLPDTYRPTYASSLRILTTASPGNCEATSSFICRSKRHMRPRRRHLPHAVRSR